MASLLRAVVLGSALLARSAQATAVGAIKLDNYTLDKMTAVPGLSLLVKVDKAYAYGEKEDAFKEIAVLSHKVPSFLVAEVPVQEYGDKENDDIRERYGLKEDDFPVFLFFKAGSKDTPKRFEGFQDPKSVKPVTWDDDEDGEWEAPMLGDVTTDNLRTWLKMQDIRLPAVGTIPEMDELVDKFMKASDSDKKKLLATAKEMEEGILKADDKAPIYTKVMEKVVATGTSYVSKEIERVTKVAAGKITEEKKAAMDLKLKIMGVFAEHS